MLKSTEMINLDDSNWQGLQDFLQITRTLNVQNLSFLKILGILPLSLLFDQIGISVTYIGLFKH